jgi:hypothetical protein
MQQLKNFKKLFARAFGVIDYDEIEKFIKNSLEGDISKSTDQDTYFNWLFQLEIEKHSELQYTFYFTFNTENNVVYVIIDNGINTGTVVSEFGLSNYQIKTSKEVRILSYIKQDIKSTNNYFIEIFDRKMNDCDVMRSKAVFERHRNEIITQLNYEEYDQYVTGSNNEYYSNFRKKMNSNGIFWNAIYETKEVDKRFV